MQLIKPHSLILFVKATSNNILCTVSTLKGETLQIFSLGFYKQKGIKKTANTNIFFLVKSLSNYIINNFSSLSLYIKISGINKNKNEFIKLMKLNNFNIIFIQEKLLQPYGGCKSSKSRKI